MSPAILYALGTSLYWFAGFLICNAIISGLKLILIWPGVDRNRLVTRTVFSGSFGMSMYMFARVIPMDLGRPTKPSGIYIPLVVPIMPLQAWCLLIAATGFLAYQLRAQQEPLPEAKAILKKKSLGWGAGTLAFAALCLVYRPSLDILRGAIALNNLTLVFLLSLFIVSIFVMRLVVDSARDRKVAKTIVSHLVLLTGALLFGLPFLWMLLTSFKESRDVSNPVGMVWIPKVQQEVPYDDPKQPQYEGTYKGFRVRGIVAETLENGHLRIDIRKPYALQGYTFEAPLEKLKRVPKTVPLVLTTYQGQRVKGMAVRDQDDGRKVVNILEPPALAGQEFAALPSQLEPIREVGLRWQNYTEGLESLPIEADYGLRYVANSAYLVFMITLGTLLSSTLVAYGFARVRFPGREFLFLLMLSTMMLPGIVTMLPQFLIWVNLGWMDTYLPIWIPAFFGSAFAIFLFRQFFLGIPQEFEDAAKIDGAGHLRTYWSVMLPQIKPALVTVAIGCFIGTWGDFLGPLIYISSPEKVTVAYALQFMRNAQGDPGILMAFATLSLLPILILFFIAQRYFIESVSLSGLGGR